MRNANFESKNSPSQWKLLRVLGILFCLIVFSAGLAGAAGADGIVIDSNTGNVGGTKWSYDQYTETLTLNGDTWEYINATGIDLTIVLAGDNKITPGTSVTIDSSPHRCGIYVKGNLEIRQKEGAATGSLNVTVPSGSGDVYGIRADGKINISGGEVNVTVNDNSQAFGIYADPSSSTSEFNNIIHITKSKVAVKATALNTAVGISIVDLGRINIGIGGIVTVEANGGSDAKGISAVNGNIVNNEGTVTATATSSGNDAYGLYASHTPGTDSGNIHIDASSRETTAVGSTQAIHATNSLTVSTSQSIQASTSTDTTENGLNSVTVDDFIGNFSSYKYVVITKLDSSTDPSNPGSPGNPQSSSSGSAGDGRYFSFPRTTDNGGSVTFGKSPVVTEIILPQGSKGSVVLAVESVEDWPGIEQTPYAFEITAPEKADGISEILFRVELSELERLEVEPEGIGIFVKKGDEWMPLLSVFELGEKYAYYTVETDTLGEFEIRFEEGGAVSGETEEPVEPETPADPVIPDEPQEVLPPIEPPVKDEEPKSPVPILAVLAGLSAAAALRRK
ncbi:MAG: hypothetical protein E7Z72_03105 [Methanocorpusculum parvum]|nr:hypothetical protein [Methanocorpusculum parvum]